MKYILIVRKDEKYAEQSLAPFQKSPVIRNLGAIPAQVLQTQIFRGEKQVMEIRKEGCVQKSRMVRRTFSL